MLSEKPVDSWLLAIHTVLTHVSTAIHADVSQDLLLLTEDFIDSGAQASLPFETLGYAVFMPKGLYGTLRERRASDY